MAINWKNFEQNNKAIAFNPIQDGGGPRWGGGGGPKKPPPRPPSPLPVFPL